MYHNQVHIYVIPEQYCTKNAHNKQSHKTHVPPRFQKKSSNNHFWMVQTAKNYAN